MHMELGCVVRSKKNIQEPDIAIFKNIMVPWFIAHGHLCSSK